MLLCRQPRSGRASRCMRHVSATEPVRSWAIRTRATCCAAAILLCACAPMASIKFDASQVVGAVLVEPGPTVSIATPSGGGARVAAAATLGALTSVIALFAGNPFYISSVAKAVGQEAERAACVTSYFDGHPDLAGEIAGIVDRELLKKVVFDNFLSYLDARSSLKVVAVQDGSGVGDPTHEAVMRQAIVMGVDVLFELSRMKVDFDFGYYGKDCAIRPVVSLNYRVILVSRDKELQAGNAREIASPEESGSKLISQWLDDRGSLDKLIETGFKDAMPRIWYVGLPSR